MFNAARNRIKKEKIMSSVYYNNINHFQRTRRRNWTWTDYRIDQGEKVIEIVNELEAYWPLTLRQTHLRQ
jgi:hypothetical protein